MSKSATSETPLLHSTTSINTSASSSPSAQMLNRSQVREKNVTDEMELVENGTTDHLRENGTNTKRELSSVAIGNSDKPDPQVNTSGGLSLRDQRALALLVALCELPLFLFLFIRRNSFSSLLVSHFSLTQIYSKVSQSD